MGQRVVVLERDINSARSLACGLLPHFSVQVIPSREELRQIVLQNTPQAVVVNIEHWRLDEVTSLRRSFPVLPIVCTHRVPDESLWIAALEAGATDVCAADDVASVLTSLLRSTDPARRTAA